MRTIIAIAFGTTGVLQQTDVEDPVPGPGQIVVDVEAVGVLWLDTQIRQGRGPEQFAVAPPYVPGGTVGGTVSAAGPGAGDSWLGRRVLVHSAVGGYAERVPAETTALVPVPDGLGLPEATALLDDGTTALALLERTPVRPGEHVLVLPAAGGLGSLLVQMAASAGATVIGAARGSAKADLVRSLGATHVVDYAEDGWSDAVRRLVPDGPGVVFDGIGGAVGATAAALVTDGGRFSSYGVAGGAPTVVPPERRVTATGMEQLAEFGADRARRARDVLDAAAAGRLRPVIGQTYPLVDAARAHDDIEERRVTGKSLLLVSGSDRQTTTMPRSASSASRALPGA
ncbi:MAG: zinc-binding dehydrogenase [Pseudonocardia sp.]|nr:zinc-binding dehydrogenase [Pseudonocardia sp.]